ncbi:MAG: RNA 2',3'-cyclic phosphodiesterase [Telluria sp.]
MDTPPATTRLFLALWPDAAVRDALRSWRDLWSWPRGASPVATSKLHLTLHFLGNQPSERVPEFTEGLAVPFSPFRVELGEPAVWSGGIAVLEPQQQPPELLQLHADLSQALLALGLTPEARKYRPHVTMSRRANSAVLTSSGPAIGWDISSYALVESRPGSAGYTVLAHYG